VSYLVASRVPLAEIIPPVAADVDQASIMDTAKSLTKDFVPAEVTALLRRVAAAQLEPIAEKRVLAEIKTRTKSTIDLRTLEKTLREAKGALGVGARQVGQSRTPGWWGKLACFENGEPKGILMNVAIVLREAQEWQGVLAFNEFANAVYFVGQSPLNGDAACPCEFADNDDRRVTEWMQQAGIHVRKEVVGDAVEMVAREHTYHPVREYLGSLTWDGKPRLDTWLTYYAGVDDTLYARAVGRCCLISAVARVYRPGVKADCMMILEGPQGIGKSTAIRILGDPCEAGWFVDDIKINGFGSKEAKEQIRGMWVAELAELDGISRADIDSTKAFLSRTTDHYRPPWGKRAADFPRHCIFIGSVNGDEYLKDSTGGRRFWPIRCRSIDIPALLNDRDQLWAEAVARFRGGTKWWLDDEEIIAQATAEQEAGIRPMCGKSRFPII